MENQGKDESQRFLSETRSLKVMMMIWSIKEVFAFSL